MVSSHVFVKGVIRGERLEASIAMVGNLLSRMLCHLLHRMIGVDVVVGFWVSLIGGSVDWVEHNSLHGGAGRWKTLVSALTRKRWSAIGILVGGRILNLIRGIGLEVIVTGSSKTGAPNIAFSVP